MYAMRDVFGRFGNLIDVYMLSGKICGYAKYASKESAEQAIQVSTICRQHGHKLLAVVILFKYGHSLTYTFSDVIPF